MLLFLDHFSFIQPFRRDLIRRRLKFFLNRITAVLFFFIISACAPNSTSNHVGDSVEALENIQGKPESTDSIKAQKNVSLYRYSSGDSYQIENKKVTALHRAPLAEESKIQNWYQMRGAARREEALAHSDLDRSPHQEYGSVRFLDLGKIVVFDRSTGKVVKVVEYEAR